MSSVSWYTKISSHTTLLDIAMFGVAGTAAVYLVEGDQKCLIDSGSRAEAPGLVRKLRALFKGSKRTVLLLPPLRHPCWYQAWQNCLGLFYFSLDPPDMFAGGSKSFLSLLDYLGNFWKS